MDSTSTWIALVTIYLIAVAVRDFRRKQYVWVTLSGIAVLTALFALPPVTNTIKIDLPANK
jgi:hypothetical protein